MIGIDRDLREMQVKQKKKSKKKESLEKTTEKGEVGLQKCIVFQGETIITMSNDSSHWSLP